MTRVRLASLIAVQRQRGIELEAFSTNLKERAAGTLNRTLIQMRTTVLNERWTEIRKAHNEIVIRAESEAHPYITENDFQSMQLVYEDMLDWLSTELDKTSGEEEGTGRRRQREPDNDEEAECPAKLPRLDLPTFSGNYEDWDSFSDVFTSLVHRGRRLADSTKLQYLKSCLTGPAAQLVNDVPIVGINYASTWRALQDRFHNPRMTINTLIDSIYNLPFLKKESATELRALLDNAQSTVRALTNLKIPLDTWDGWLVRAIEIRLDPESRKQWEAETTERDRKIIASTEYQPGDYLARSPKFSEISAFLEKRAISLSAIHVDQNDKGHGQSHKGPFNSNKGAINSRRVHHAHQQHPFTPTKCALCSQSHPLAFYPTYLGKDIKTRQNEVRHLRLCYNCLGAHRFQTCQSKGRCRTCNGKHHSTLHYDKQTRTLSGRGPEANPQKSISTTPAQQVSSHLAQLISRSAVSSNFCNTVTATNKHPILLATAQVIIISPHGKHTRARALLDQGSEATFVSDSLVQLLGLKRERAQTSIMGVGGCKAGIVKSFTTFTLCSRLDSTFKLEVQALILPRLTEHLPARNLIDLDIGPFRDLQLADPKFYTSDRIDMMIGADLYGQLLRSGLKTFPATLLVAQNTALGWIVSGPTRNQAPRRAVATYQAVIAPARCTANDDLSDAIERFWKMEEIPKTPLSLKPDDEVCERLFVETHTRDKGGRFVVHPPLKSERSRRNL